MSPNVALIEAVARGLGPIVREFVFTGGSASGLLLTDPASAPPRVTRDVDVIAEVTTYGAYALLSERLRDAGFLEDGSEGAPICRWISRAGLLLDVMPTSGAALGFSNPWYPEAARSAIDFALAPDLQIRLISGPLFLATKLVAFENRGGQDYYMSHDLEDIINVVDGRPELPAEVATIAAPEVRLFLREKFTQLLADVNFIPALPGHLRGDAMSQARLPFILTRLRRIASTGANQPAISR